MSLPVERSVPASDGPTLVEILASRAQLAPAGLAFAFLADDGGIHAQHTYAELDQEARAIGARLQGLGTEGECVLLAYAPGLSFVAGFFGCLYAGAIGIPLPLPRAKASPEGLLRIVRDSHARVAMTAATTLGRLEQQFAKYDDDARPVWIASDDTETELADAWTAPPSDASALAYLQYTSGSTSDRKGVMISHANVTNNVDAIDTGFQHTDKSVFVSWLPHFHDLGLVGGILQPLYHGCPAYLLSPTAFVQQPARWLNAVTQYRGTHTMSPNFGFDACVRQVSPEQCVGLDLGCWEVALSGAETVRQETLDAFTEKFGPFGFGAETLDPAYGLAEATLVVSGGMKGEPPRMTRADAVELERGRIVAASEAVSFRWIVGCGQVVDETEVAIVDPSTRRRRAAYEVGEIWVRGPGVARGYWQRPAETEETFGALLEDGTTGPFLRTGDLGYLDQGELFITGRLKDVIVIRGSNHYPQDIEWTVEQCDPALKAGCGAAFSIEEDGGERLIVAQELTREGLRKADLNAISAAARRAVAEEHNLQLRRLVFLRTGTVPRTSSGKIQRRRTRADYLEGQLDTVSVPAAVSEPSMAPGALAENDTSSRLHPAATPAPTADDLVGWLREYADGRLNSRLMDALRSIPPHVVLDFGNRGLLGLEVPRELGGTGLNHREAARVLEQLGAIDQTLAMMVIVHNTLGIRPILKSAAPTRRDVLVPTLARGRELAAFAITEPEAGSSPQHIVSTATPDGPTDWRLHGRKSWSGTAGWASVINVFVRTLGADGTKLGTSGFVVSSGSKGLRMGAEALTLGVRGMVQNTIHLEGVRVGADDLLGPAAGGMTVAQDAMMHGRLSIGATSVGGIKRCIQLMHRYATRRTISTGRLIENPVMLGRLGSLSGAVTALEALVHQIAGRRDQGKDVPLEAYVACKTAGPEWLWRAADSLVQFLGGRGYIETNEASRLLRDARVTRILEGPTEALTMFLGSRVVNAGERKFLSSTLGAKEVADRLDGAAGAILERCTAPHARFADATTATRWAYALIGEVATNAFLLAALLAYEREEAPHQSFTAWAWRHFEHSVDVALKGPAEEATELDPEGAARAVDEFVARIGDTEQHLAGEELELDAMLTREHVSVHRNSTVAPETNTPEEAPQTAPVEPPGDELHDAVTTTHTPWR